MKTDTTTIIRDRGLMIMIVVLLIIAFAIRIVGLENAPPGFFADEADIGNNAYKLLNRIPIAGYNNPMFIPAFDQYRGSIPSLFTIPYVAIFGRTEFAVRTSAVVAGTLSLAFVYLLARSVFGSRNSALLCMVLVILSPWHIHMSRIGWEAIYFILFTTAGAWLLLSRRLYLAAIVMGLSLYTYYAAILQSTALLFAGVWLFSSKRSVRELIKPLFVYLVVSVPYIVGLLQGIAQVRAHQVLIFNSYPGLSGVLIAITNYINHFLPSFLFVDGDAGFYGQLITRHSVLGLGQLYSWQSVFLIIGIVSCIDLLTKYPVLMTIYSKFTKNTAVFFLIWLLLYPTGSMFTLTTGPLATRSSIGIVPLHILITVGIVVVYRLIVNFSGYITYKSLRNGLLYSYGVILILVSTVSFAYFTYQYHVRYPLMAADYWGWQYGARESIAYMISYHNEYDTLYLENVFNGTEVLLWFYDTDQTCTNCSITEPYLQDDLEKLFDTEQNDLFVISNTTYQELNRANTRLLHTIWYPNGEPAFRAITFKN